MADSDHILLLPYPNQGHINPMLQFAKRLAALGPRTTLATTRFILATTPPAAGPVRLAAISDGFDTGGFREASSTMAYLDRFELTGSQTLADLLGAEAAAGRPVRLLVFDSFLHWAGDVGRRDGLATAAFFTQSAAVNLVYWHVRAELVEVPVRDAVELPGLPRLQPRDLPPFLHDREEEVYLVPVLNQYKNLEEADEVLINTFYELEPEEMDFLKAACGAKSVGPRVPSLYLDNRLPTDTNYSFNLFKPEAAPCMAWLNSQPPASVVYVSFGSVAKLSADQMAELALGLTAAGKPFLWVVRATEVGKLPPGFAEEFSELRLVVGWSPQLEVLAHAAVGCFLTHSGWNSTVEALCLGVPVVAMPQWTDQPTNAKYAEDVWGIGVRVRAEVEGGLVRKEEVERCVREVMGGGRSGEMRRNAARWRQLARAAMGEDGSSNENIVGLVAKYCQNE